MSTATLKRRSSITSYDQLIKHTEKPLASRRELNIGRGGASVIPRKFHLSKDEITALTEQYKETKVFPNPHNKGFYYYLVQSLIELGINEKHAQTAVMKRVEKLMSDPSTIEGEGTDATTAWDRWKDKEPRNKDTGKSWDARFDQNVLVMQRLTGLTPYGRKLLDVGQKVLGKKGAVIDVLVADTGTRYLRLNTQSDRPVNESKVRGMGSPAAIKAERAEKRAEKASPKATTKTRTRKLKATQPEAPAAAAESTEAVAETATANG